MNKGFTLVELLVVVLIVGVLAAIALPQYEQAVEKSRMSEALVNLKAIADAAQRYYQAYPGSTITSKANIADVTLKGGSWTNDTTFKTSLFTYTLGTSSVTAARQDTDYNYTLTMTYEGVRSCDAKGKSDQTPLCTFFTNM